MRIGIDCRLGGTRHAGIGRYIENLLLRLPKLDQQITWVFFYQTDDQKTTWQAQLAALDNVEWVKAPIRHYTLAEQWQLPSIFVQAKLDLLHVPHFNVPWLYRQPTVITIHDLLWHEYYGTQVTTLPSWQYWLKYVAYRWLTTQAIQHARRILVPAQTIHQTLARYYPAQTSKVVVTYEGATASFSATQTPPKAVKKQFVYVGSLYPHKNLEVVIKALVNLPDYRLIIVGVRNVFQDRVRALVDQMGVKSQVTFQGYLSDDQLAELLQESTALVQPSLSEGFGLTGIEAMATGIPVLASRIPVFEEVYRDGAEFFEPHSPAAFKAAVENLVAHRSSLIKRGQAVANSYSWDTMAQQTLAVYHQAIK